jgi:hypothetical protein
MTKTNIAIVILHTLLRIPVVFIVPFAMLFARKTDRKTTHYTQDGTMQRYTLPKAFKWLLTPDEDLAGGMYEPTVKKIYDKYGWWICSVYWIGLRNQAQGLLWTRGKEVELWFRKEHKIHLSGGTAHYLYYEYCNDHSLNDTTISLGLFKLVFEWEIAHDHYRDYTETGYFTIPKLSFKGK